MIFLKKKIDEDLLTNIIVIDIPNIYSVALCTISFKLINESELIKITISKERIYTVQNYVKYKKSDDSIKVVCNNSTRIFIYANTKHPGEINRYKKIIAHGQASYPFISSDFILDIKEIESDKRVSININIPKDITLLTKVSYLKIDRNKFQFHDIWNPSSEKRTYYSDPIEKKFVKNGLEIRFRARVRIEKLIQGLVPLLLPFFIGLVGFILEREDIPHTLKSPTIFFSIFVAFTSLFIRVFLKAGVWLGINFLSILYMLSIGISFLFLFIYLIQLELLFYLLYFVFLILCFIYVSNIMFYYATGEFRKEGKIFLAYLEYIVVKLYRYAWKVQERIVNLHRQYKRTQRHTDK